MAEGNPPTISPNQVTLLLEAVSSGRQQASEELLPLIYEQLRRLAQSHMNRESPGNTLQPTALVHEAYLRLVGGQDVRWANRAHFFASAALAMRRILVDRARSRGRVKRGGELDRVELQDGAMTAEPPSTDLLALDEALPKLEQQDKRKYDIVMLRYFAGLSIEETAAALDISPATVKTEWKIARVLLYRAINGAAPEGDA